MTSDQEGASGEHSDGWNARLPAAWGPGEPTSDSCLRNPREDDRSAAPPWGRRGDTATAGSVSTCERAVVKDA